MDAYDKYVWNLRFKSLLRFIGWLVLAAAISHSLDPYKFIAALFAAPFVMFVFWLTGAADWVVDLNRHRNDPPAPRPPDHQWTMDEM